MRVEFHDPGSPAWSGLLSRTRHDYHHLPGYLSFAARHQFPGRPTAFVAEEDGRSLFLPLIVRPVPDELVGDDPPAFDATSPRGYPGPLLTTPDAEVDPSFLARSVAALSGALRERRVAAAFVRFHPLFPLPLDPFRRAGMVVEHGDSVSIDLTLEPDVLRRQTRENHRRDIRAAAALGYTARIDERWERFDAFIDIYRQSMSRVEAVPHWVLSREYFLGLKAGLGDRLHLGVVEVGDSVAAASLLTEVDGVVEYAFGGTADRFLSVSPSKLLIDHVRWWAKDRGDRCLHLAGSLRRDDSLLHFKAGFSPLRHPVYTWRLVTDEGRYRALVDRRHLLSGSRPGDDFFPAYRELGPVEVPQPASPDAVGPGRQEGQPEGDPSAYRSAPDPVLSSPTPRDGEVA